MAVFCLGTVLFLAPRDLLLERTRDVEVWLGLEVRGTAAHWTAPLHWALFLVGGWAFWTQRPWILPWAAGYAFYVALSHLVWNQTSASGRGWAAGVVQALLLSIPGLLLLRARPRAGPEGTGG